MIVMTGGKIAYTRPDGVKIIPLACLKDVKSWRDDMRWRLSTDIYNCTAPGRFCIGLAEHVTIIKGDELKKYVSEYVRKRLAKSYFTTRQED